MDLSVLDFITLNAIVEVLKFMPIDNQVISDTSLVTNILTVGNLRLKRLQNRVRSQKTFL
jgi:hypothetical protein